MSDQDPPRSPAVLLVGHGTRDATGTEQFFELGVRLAERLDPVPVESALLEFQQPDIPTAWKRLVDQGASHIHVAPLLLFAAGHAKADIPEIVEQCRSATPDVTFDQCRPLSRHRSLVDLVVARISHTLSVAPRRPDHAASASVNRRETTALVMVGRGNRDPCAQADMRLLSEVVARRVAVRETYTAFYAMAEPNMPSVLHRVAESGRFERVIVHPHLLFSGRLFDAIENLVEQASERYADIDFVLSDYLGPDRRVADAIAGRIALNEEVQVRSHT